MVWGKEEGKRRGIRYISIPDRGCIIRGGFSPSRRRHRENERENGFAHGYDVFDGDGTNRKASLGQNEILMVWDKFRWNSVPCDHFFVWILKTEIHQLVGNFGFCVSIIHWEHYAMTDLWALSLMLCSHFLDKEVSSGFIMRMYILRDLEFQSLIIRVFLLFHLLVPNQSSFKHFERQCHEFFLSFQPLVVSRNLSRFFMDDEGCL